MQGNKYEPAPVDTSDIVLSEELLTLIERIAENIHDVWAVGRISDLHGQRSSKNGRPGI